MKPRLLHRLLGLAGIYAHLNAQRQRLDVHGRRLAKQERTMSDILATQQSADQKVAQLAAQIALVATGVTSIRADLEALKNAHANPDDATTLSPAGLAALDGALVGISALAATFAAPPEPDAPSEPEAPAEPAGS